MKKTVSYFILAGMLSACNTTNTVAIRSITNPEDYYKNGGYSEDSWQDQYDNDMQSQQTTITNQTTETTTTSVSDTEDGKVTETTTTKTETTSASSENIGEPSNTESTNVPEPANTTDTTSSDEVKKAPMSSVETKKTEPITDVSKTAYGAVGTYKIGNPYLIDGVSYYPHEDYNYTEIGIASWYGPDFHGGKTANGEIFDENKLTAAHRTLPMPSLVRVTNLENGMSVNVKVNDRGPYKRDRILDLSSAAADVLGIKQKGSARVKVEILPEESKKLKELAMANQNTDIYPANMAYSSFAIANKPDVQDGTAVVRPMEKTSEPATTPAPQPVAEPIPAPTPIPSPAPASAKPVATMDGEYFVQVAAYSTYEKAEALKDKLVNIGTVKIFKSVVNGKTLYKVRLGEFATKQQAEEIQRSVTAHGISGSRVILKEDGAFKWNIK